MIWKKLGRKYTYRISNLILLFLTMLAMIILLSGCGTASSEEEGSKNSANPIDSLLGIQQVADEVKNSKIWDGYVQIGDMVIKPYSGMTLREFEQEGFDILKPDVGYNTLVGDNINITLTKENVEIQTQIIADDGTPQKYGDCPIATISNVSITPDDGNIPVWIHDGIQLGGEISQLTDIYPLAEYDSSDQAYTVHPISFGWEYKAQPMIDMPYDFCTIYQLDDDLHINGYQCEHYDVMTTMTDSIPYEETTIEFGTWGDPYEITFQAPVNLEASIPSEYKILPICTNGTQIAKVYFINLDWASSEDRPLFSNLREIDINEAEKIYETDTYVVYWQKDREYYIGPGYGKYHVLSKDHNNTPYGVSFALMIIDSDGNIVTSKPYMDNDPQEAQYVIMDGQKMLDMADIFESGSSDTPYAYKLAIDIFDHLGQMTVSKGIPKA